MRALLLAATAQAAAVSMDWFALLWVVVIFAQFELAPRGAHVEDLHALAAPAEEALELLRDERLAARRQPHHSEHYAIPRRRQAVARDVRSPIQNFAIHIAVLTDGWESHSIYLCCRTGKPAI